MAKVWNADLAHAAEVRVWYHMSKGSSKEFMWRKAHEALLAVDKEIRQFSTGRVVNLPRLKEKSTQLELEQIIRGERPVVPDEMQNAEAMERSDYAEHPYLKRMQFRGGGYAILMALHQRSLEKMLQQFMYKSELLHHAQQFCDVSMEGGWGTASGWSSIRSLLSHRLVTCSRGPHNGREEYRLTPEGLCFLQAMLQRWAPAVEPADGRDSPPPKRPRPRWAARTLVAVEAEVIARAPTPCQTARRDESIAISSESEHDGHLHAASASRQVVLLVDERERLHNAAPRRFYEDIATSCAVGTAQRRRLKLGDFAWLHGCPGRRGMVDLLLERKRVADLVARSARRDHLKQLRRMERCGLQHVFFLIEGNLNLASSCAVYDAELEVESFESGIYSKEDIDVFCAELIVGGSKVGVLQTHDSAGTIRLLTSISQWISWSCTVPHDGLLLDRTLEQFESDLPIVAQDPADLGATGQTGHSHRSAEMRVSRKLFHRMHQPADTPSVVWIQNDEPELCGELVVSENGPSAEVLRVVVVILEGGLLLSELLRVANAGASTSTAAVATRTATALAQRLPAAPGARRLLIVEGLSRAVQAFARSTESSGALPREAILPCAELLVLLLDLNCSWRCRVHNSEPSETTKRFLQVLVQVALSHPLTAP